MTHDELKPCPFCNGKAKLMPVRIGSFDGWLPIAEHDGVCPIGCMTHDGVTAYISKSAATMAWNRRAS